MSLWNNLLGYFDRCVLGREVREGLYKRFPEPKDRYLLGKYYDSQKDFSEETYENCVNMWKNKKWRLCNENF